MNQGFTLLEVIIAIAVLTLGIVMILQVFPLGFRVEKGTQMQTQAVLLAQEQIEELSSKAYQDITVGTTTENSLPTPFEKFSRQTKISYVNADLEEVAVETGLKKIEVIVWWQSPLKVETKNVELSTLVVEK